MRVAVFTPVFWPYRGGIGRVAENNAISLKALGCEVDIYTPHFNKSWPSEEKFQGVHVLRLRPKSTFGNAAWIAGNLDLSRCDIIHLHYPFIGGVRNILKWKKQYHKPLLVTYHMDLIARGWRGFLFKIYSLIVAPKIARAADRIIFSSLDYGRSSFMAKLVEKQPEKFLEIPFGVSPLTSILGKIESRQELKLGEKEKIILFVGALDKAHYFKGLEVLFLAIKKIVPFRNDFKLVIVGDGEKRNFYEGKVRKLGIASQVKFFSKVSDIDLIKHYRAADFLVLPSTTRSEAYGMVLIEAASQGLPVIASNLPGVREQVSERGLLFEAGNSIDLRDKILSFLDDEENLRQKGEVAKVWVVHNRSLSQEAEKILTVYKSLVEG